MGARVHQTGAKFVALAENVAFGPSAADLHDQWMKSPPHRANLLDPKLNALGVAVEERNGRLFAVQDFSQAVANLTFEAQESQLAALLKARGLRAADNEDARRVCKTGPNAGLIRPPSFEMRYGTVDLRTLPEGLVRELQSSHYRAAAVAACAPGSSSDFSGYEIAILLYQ